MKTSSPAADPEALEHLLAAADAEAASIEKLDSRAARRAKSPANPESGAGTLPWSCLRVTKGHNPRKKFDNRELDRLAATIRDQGLLQPIVVRPARDGSGTYVVTAGERRYRALGRLAERGEMDADCPVPVIIRHHAGREALLAALIENLQRSNLEPLEEAEAFALLCKDHGMDTAEIAETLGLTRRTVQLRLQLLRLVPPVQAALRSGEISFDVARVLAGAPPDEQHLALETYRAAPPEHQNAEAVRTSLRSRAIPFSRALFNPRLYSSHDGAIFDGGKAGKYFCDRQLFLRLQRDAVANLRNELAQKGQWVETVESARVPQGYQEVHDGSGPGALILLANGYDEVHVLPSVRRVEGADTATPARCEPPAAQQPPPPAEDTGQAPAAEESADEEPGEDEPAPAVPAPSRLGPFQDALATRPETALRVAVTAALARRGTCGLRFALPSGASRPRLGPRIARSLGSLAEALDLDDSPEALLDRLARPKAKLPDEVDIYRRLARLPDPTLRRIHAALVALATCSVSPRAPRSDQPAGPSRLVAQISKDLGVHSREPRPEQAEPEPGPRLP